MTEMKEKIYPTLPTIRENPSAPKYRTSGFKRSRSFI